MTGLILVVDDVPANVKLLEAKLSGEYYDVVTGRDGYEAIKMAKEHKPDLILLDVMMPGMDGFEACRQIKKDPEISHIPVVMVTALSEPSDRVQGLEAGADDFITKPINDTALFARVRSLIRIKVLIDELRLRDQSGSEMGVMNDVLKAGQEIVGARVVVIDDDAVQSRKMQERLSEHYEVMLYSDHQQALEYLRQNPVDLIIVSTLMTDIDGLRLATQFKAVELLRHVPVIMLMDEDDKALMLKALELGVNDYLIVPVDYNEMSARVKTQIRRKRYQDALKSNYQESVSMAITDGLTRLYNRHYLDTHLINLTKASLENGKAMSVLIMDMDHFKSVNDTYGHDVGDEILKQLAQMIVGSTRSADLAARYGGEEFVVLMPETDFTSAYEVADRMRRKIESTPFIVSHAVGQINKTVSIGVASLNPSGDDGQRLLKRADTALYESKNTGRNQVCPRPAGVPVPDHVQAHLDNPKPAASAHAPAPAPVAAPAPAPAPVVEPLPAPEPFRAAPVVTSSAPAYDYAPVSFEVVEKKLNKAYDEPKPESEFQSAAAPAPEFNYQPVTTAPTQIQLKADPERPLVVYDLVRPAKPPRPSNSPIDDEPEGTF